MTIIIEGPDGAGKTTLVQSLQYHFPGMEQHPRFCTSTGGPISDLAEAVHHDVRTDPTNFLYDRHPVISEFIYGLAIPERRLAPAFLTPAMGRIRNRVAYHSVTIFCIPPLQAVWDNVLVGDDMPGVKQNIEKIYDHYVMHQLMWPGQNVIFDYTQQENSWNAVTSLLSRTRNRLWKES